MTPAPTSTEGGRGQASAEGTHERDGSESEATSAPRESAKGQSVKAGHAPSAKKPERLDTVALVERVGAPRDVPLWLGVLVIVLLSAAASLTTYRLRVSANARAASAAESASATAAKP